MQDPFVTSASFIDIPGVRVADEIAGRGSCVVFLDCGLLDRSIWDGQVAFFARTHRAVRYDMRCSGQSMTTPTAEPFAHHEDLRELLKALEVAEGTRN